MTSRVDMFGSGRPLTTAPTTSLSYSLSPRSRPASIQSTRAPGKRSCSFLTKSDPYSIRVSSSGRPPRLRSWYVKAPVPGPSSMTGPVAGSHGRVPELRRGGITSTWHRRRSPDFWNRQVSTHRARSPRRRRNDLHEIRWPLQACVRDLLQRRRRRRYSPCQGAAAQTLLSARTGRGSLSRTSGPSPARSS